MTDDELELNEKDREFIAWVRNPDTLSADLRAKWHELLDIAWLPDAWKCHAIERELQRRGESLI